MLRLFTPPNNIPNQEIIYVMGGPASGKGTVCKKLEEQYGYKHISTGDLLRNLIKPEQATQQDLKEIVEKVKKGEMINAETILTLVITEMKKYPNVKGFLLDGYPRTQDNIPALEKGIVKADKILYLLVSEEIMKARALKRSGTEKRSDDNEETILKRINVFNEQTLPIISYLRERSQNFYEINAAQDKSIVLEEAARLFNPKTKLFKQVA